MQAFILRRYRDNDEPGTIEGIERAENLGIVLVPDDPNGEDLATAKTRTIIPGAIRGTILTQLMNSHGTRLSQTILCNDDRTYFVEKADTIIV